ncbi:hypothetical protein J3Q64DRAFT_1807934 [Phycomyces blakesleeanus]|uniref:Yip1 domain-containing protein n=1 Tax=Phycomyces blakesleeanus TaxID=4837 RepID=A0ABR3B8E4_PHYBL
MSGKNQYNVLVDMDDNYTQPATIESDGLEFQDFSSSPSVNKSTGAPPPLSMRAPDFFEPQQQGSSRGVGKPIWSLDYYAGFFDVDTSQVIERCVKTLYPVGDYAADTLNNQPDMYGPFWLSTTVVFLVFVCSSLAGSLAAYLAGAPHVYDFRLLSYAVFVVYTYTFLSPVLLWGATKYYGCQPSLMEIINYYGYSLTVWVPVSQKILERQKRQYAERKEKADTYVNQTPFRYVERNFKSRVPPPDLSHVVDFNNLDNNLKRINDEIVELHITNDLRSLSSLFGEHDTEWENRAHKAYGLKSSPGFIFIPNPFTPRAQRHLVKQCLSEYTLSPSTSNLDTHYVTPPNGFWNLYEREHLQDLKEGDADYFVAKKAGFTGSEQRYDSSDSEDENSNNKSNSISNFNNTFEKETVPTPTACSREFEPVQWQPKPDPPPAPSVPLLSPRELFRKMRWTTIGCHYHWPTKTYHLDRRFPVPEDVRDLTQAVAHAVERVGYEGDKSRSWKNEYLGADFKAEAGVVNYYQYKDTLMGHVDRSELNMDAPLVSLRHCSSFYLLAKWGHCCHD